MINNGIFAETPRLILRELLPTDDAGMFALDSDTEVQRYVGNKAQVHIDESRAVIAFIRQQYIDNGIGRWAVIEKSTNEFLGWCGLKRIKDPMNNHCNFYELGYRFQQKYWGQGFATEAARATIEYGFNTLHLEHIYAITDTENTASGHVLKKIGFRYVETFTHEGTPHHWYQCSRQV